VVNAFSEVPVELNFIFIFFKMIIMRRRRGRGRKKEKESQCTPPINFNFLLACSPLYIAYIRSFSAHCLQQTADMRKEKASLQCLQMMNFPFLLSLFKSGKYEVVMTPSVK